MRVGDVIKWKVDKILLNWLDIYCKKYEYFNDISVSCSRRFDVRDVNILFNL